MPTFQRSNDLLPNVPTIPSPLANFLTWGLGIFLVFSVFSFGAVEDWSFATCEVMLFILAGIASCYRPDFLKVPKLLWAPFWFVVALIAIGLIQLIPLPVSYWQWIGDERGTIQQDAVEAEKLLRSELYRTDPFTGEVLPEDSEPFQTPPAKSWMATTFTPLKTIRAILALLAAVALVLLLEHLAVHGRRGLRKLAWTAGFTGIAVGLFAFIQHQPGVTRILGFRESAHASGAFGPFVNENTAMGFVNPAFCFLYYLLWRRTNKHHHRSNKVGIALVFLACAIFHFTLLLIRTSGTGLWILLLFPLVLFIRILKKHPRIALVTAALPALLLAGFGTFAVYFRFTDLHGRIPIWRNTLGQGHWILGNGLQSFADRFPAVVTSLPFSGESRRWLFPENEYLQLFFEAGIPALLLAAMSVAYLAHLGWQALKANSAVFLLVPALWTGIMQAFTDFAFHFWPIVGTNLLLVTLILVAVTPRKTQRSLKEWSSALSNNRRDLLPSL